MAETAGGRRQPKMRLSRVVGSRRMFTYDRSLLVNPVLHDAEDGVADLDQAMERTGLSMGYPAWNLLYFVTLCSLPRRDPIVVEVGTNRGFSTTVLAQAIVDADRGGAVHSIDIDPELVDIARATVARAGVDHVVELHVGDSVDVLAELAASYQTFDVVLLDGSGEHDQVLREFAIVHTKVNRDSIVYFDNSGGPGVSTALNEICKHYDGNVVEFSNCSWWPPGNAIWQLGDQSS